jgi:hypothetical protein
MPILNKLSGAVPTALIYITAGTLIDVWTIVSLVFNPPDTHTGYFWAIGFLMTGLALLVIGLLYGQFGRAARTAELAVVEPTAAAAPAPVVVLASPAVPAPAASAPAPKGPRVESPRQDAPALRL